MFTDFLSGTNTVPWTLRLPFSTAFLITLPMVLAIPTPSNPANTLLCLVSFTPVLLSRRTARIESYNIWMAYDVVSNTSRQPRSDGNALPRLHLFQHMSRFLAKKAGTSTPSLWCSICLNLVTVCNYMKGRNQIFYYAAYNARHGHVMMAMMRKRIFFT